MESGKGQKDRKKPEYMLGEQILDVKSDMEFIDKLIKDLRIDAQPRVRGVVLDIAYTLARDKLVEAMRFAKLSNRTNITVADLKMVHMEETEELRKRARTLKNVEVSQEILPKPCVEKGLLLPNWRNCQVGVTPELYVPQKCPPTRVIAARPNILRRPKDPPVIPKAQPVVPKAQAQPVVPKAQPVVPKAQPVVPKAQAQPVVPKAQPVVAKAQSVVPVAPLGRTGLPRINIIPATTRPIPRINIIPATYKSSRIVAAPPKASSDDSKSSVGSPPKPKKSRPN